MTHLRALAPWVVCLLSGCIPRLDVLLPDDGGVDGGTSLLAFGEPALVPEFIGMDVRDVCLSDDELELYFVSGGTIVRATRSSLDAPWSAPAAVVEIDSDVAETDPRVTPRGLDLYFTSYRGGRLGDIFHSVRVDRVSPWGPPILVPELSSELREGAATFDVDELEVHFGRGVEDFDILRATRTSRDAPFSTPVRADDLSSTTHESSPHLRGTRMVFDADRSGTLRDLWVAERSGPGAPFEGATPIEGVNSAATDRDPWLSADGARLYFTSDRDGLEQLYLALIRSD